MKATYVMKAIPPYCKEIRVPVEVVKWLGYRVLVRDLSIKASGKDFLIETELDSIELKVEDTP